ncbi:MULTISPECIES: hypothetical protein [unclassified Bartonella]|uniref:hypothetical protein n=1 Tax=unclassified Bartonella TaxID=2645622 RepID=UPI0023616301|nr:hypothetical protein [Bartonella sp. CM31XJBT]
MALPSFFFINVKNSDVLRILYYGTLSSYIALQNRLEYLENGFFKKALKYETYNHVKQRTEIPVVAQNFPKALNRLFK